MTNDQVLKLAAALESISNSQEPCCTADQKKVMYSIIRNADKIAPVAKAIKSVIEKMNIETGLDKYDAERIELCKKYADQDEAGDPVVIGNEYRISKRNEFEKMLTGLTEKYKGAINAVDDYLAEQSEEAVEFRKIKIDNIPDKFATGQIIKILSPIIEE